MVCFTHAAHVAHVVAVSKAIVDPSDVLDDNTLTASNRSQSEPFSFTTPTPASTLHTDHLQARRDVFLHQEPWLERDPEEAQEDLFTLQPADTSQRAPFLSLQVACCDLASFHDFSEQPRHFVNQRSWLERRSHCHHCRRLSLTHQHKENTSQQQHTGLTPERHTLHNSNKQRLWIRSFAGIVLWRTGNLRLWSRQPDESSQKDSKKKTDSGGGTD